MQFPIIVGLHRSRILDGGLLAVVALAIGLIALWPQVPVLRLFGAVLALLAGMIVRKKLTPAFSRLRLEGSGSVSVCFSERAGFETVEILPGTTVHPWLTVVRLTHPQRGSHALIVARDTMPSDDFRRLRVFLRWRIKLSAPPSDA